MLLLHRKPVMTKYPRTFHLPYSPGGTSDDRRLKGTSSFVGRSVVITEKMDGSNVCMEHDGCFARSHASAPRHPSFDAFKAAHAVVRHRIPKGIQIFGEWCYARHSIEYTKLPGYFQVFGVRTNITWASWRTVCTWAASLGFVTVPVLDTRVFNTIDELQRCVEKLASGPSACGGQREGVVVRVASDFEEYEFSKSVAKYVRANHVQTDQHWSHQAITKNQLRA